jgi:alkylhydroperoxidase/carboxymuconolactone decarboxylase family protein YurZ
MMRRVSEMGVDQRRDEIRERYVALCGQWPELYEPVLETDPDFAEAVLPLASLPCAELTLRDRALITLAVSASAAHLYEPGVRHAVRDALQAGVDAAELRDVLAMVSVLGIHTCTTAMPLLADHLAPDERERPLTSSEERTRKEFTQGRAMWPASFEDIVRADALFVDRYREFSMVPWARSQIDPKLRELIYIAIDANSTHLYELGTRLHIQNALRAGATGAEILAVLALVVQVGLHSCTMALPVLAARSAPA